MASDWLRHFWILLWNRWTEFNETWQESRSNCPLQSLCLSGRSEKRDGRSGLWLSETCFTFPSPIQDGRSGLWFALIFSTCPLKLLNGIQRNWQEARSQCSLSCLCFFGRWENKMVSLASYWQKHFRLFLWNSWTEFNKTWQILRSKCPLPTLFVPTRKTRWPSWPLIGWYIFDFYFKTAVHSTKLDRKQDLNLLWQVRVFRADWNGSHGF